MRLLSPALTTLSTQPRRNAHNVAPPPNPFGDWLNDEDRSPTGHLTDSPRNHYIATPPRYREDRITYTRTPNPALERRSVRRRNLSPNVLEMRSRYGRREPIVLTEASVGSSSTHNNNIRKKVRRKPPPPPEKNKEPETRKVGCCETKSGCVGCTIV